MHTKPDALNKSTLGDSAIKAANKAKTPYGAANIIRVYHL